MNQVIEAKTAAEKDAELIASLKAQLKAREDELREYVRVEAVLVAARVIGEERLRQAHDLVQNIR